MSDAFYLFLFGYTELNDLDSVLLKERDNLTPLTQRNILCRTVISCPGSCGQKIQIEAMVDGHVALCQEAGYRSKRLFAGKEGYLIRIAVRQAGGRNAHLHERQPKSDRISRKREIK